jgi:predicted TIM-barrel fold metal-dependent hydrolase
VTRPPTGAVDTHAHVFVRPLAAAAQARYLPDYDASPEDYLARLDAHGLDGGLLVQPSFLGTDNSFLLRCLARYPDRLRGVLVVEPASAAGGGEAGLDVVGVVGVRLNLIGRAAPDLTAPGWRALGAALAARGQHLEVQARGAQWLALGPALARWPGAVVLDHLGLPGGSAEVDRAVLELAAAGHVWTKLSAPYRTARGAAAATARRLVERGGVSRLLWGSDWPWTGFEGRHDYGACLDWAAGLLGAGALGAVLVDNPRRLLGWSPRPDVARSTA